MLYLFPCLLIMVALTLHLTNTRRPSGWMFEVMVAAGLALGLWFALVVMTIGRIVTHFIR